MLKHILKNTKKTEKVTQNLMATQQNSNANTSNQAPIVTAPSDPVPTPDQDPVIIHPATNSNSNQIAISFDKFVDSLPEHVPNQGTSSSTRSKRKSSTGKKKRPEAPAQPSAQDPAPRTKVHAAEPHFPTPEEAQQFFEQSWADGFNPNEPNEIFDVYNEMPKTYAELDKAESEELFKNATQQLLKIFNKKDIGKNYDAAPVPELEALLSKQTKQKLQFGNIEGEVAAVEGYDPETNMFLVRWKNTTEPAASIAYLDWCFVYAGLYNSNNGQGVSAKVMKKAYYQWRYARIATGLEPVRIKTNPDGTQVQILEYPSAPKHGFVHSLRNLSKKDIENIPQVVIPALENIWHKEKPKAEEIAARLDKGEKYRNSNERLTHQGFNRLDTILYQARQLLGYDPENPAATLPDLSPPEEEDKAEDNQQNPPQEDDDDSGDPEYQPPPPKPAKPTPAQPPAQDDDPKDPEWQPEHN